MKISEVAAILLVFAVGCVFYKDIIAGHVYDVCVSKSKAESFDVFNDLSENFHECTRKGLSHTSCRHTWEIEVRKARATYKANIKSCIRENQ